MTQSTAVADFEAFAWADASPVLLLDPLGVVLAVNPAARDAGFNRGQPLADALPEGFPRRCAMSREGFAARLAVDGRSPTHAHGAGWTAPDGRRLVLLRLRPMEQAARNFAMLTRQIDALNAEIARRRTSEAELRAVLATAPDGVMLLDGACRIRMVNPACCALLGYDEAALVGASAFDMVVRDAATAGDAPGRWRALVGAGPTPLSARRADGRGVDVEVSVGAMQRGEISDLVVMLRDMSERRTLEAQLRQSQKMEAIGQLAGGVAHDFNNLLTVILGDAELLVEGLGGQPALEELAQEVQAAAERGAELTRRLLAFGRRQFLAPAMIDCGAQLRALAPLLRRTLRDDIALRLDLAEDLRPAFVDGGQLDAAVLNLALNAQDAMPSGGRLIIATANARLDAATAASRPELRAGDFVMISVTDTGAGMSAEVRRRAFDPFFTTKGVGEGSGLGLSQVFGFAAQSGGFAAIYSELGLGAAVRVYLPVADADARPAPPPPPQGRGRDGSASAHVLVVEDDAFVRAYAAACLAELGHRSTLAENAPQALAILRQGAEVDVMFTDVVMPGGLDGFELAARARSIRPDLKVLLTSGYPFESLARAGRSPGRDRVLTKPYRRDVLAARLSELLAGP